MTEAELSKYDLAAPYTDFEKRILEKAAWCREQGDGYFKVHSTNPQTMGYSLADSPVGLLAWIYEKLYIWTDDYEWDDDEGTLNPALCKIAFDDLCCSSGMDLDLLVF